MKILSIETSCDETSVAIVDDGRKILTNRIYSQIDIHQKYGGVVPEIASRNHVTKLPYIIDEALAESKLILAEMDAIAVTNGPGLVGALLIGLSTAKAMAYSLGKPLIGVHHIEGHIAANFLQYPELEPQLSFEISEPIPAQAAVNAEPSGPAEAGDQPANPEHDASEDPVETTIDDTQH